MGSRGYNPEGPESRSTRGRSGEQLRSGEERGAEATTLRTGSAATRRRTGSTTTRRRTGSRGYNPGGSRGYNPEGPESHSTRGRSGERLRSGGERGAEATTLRTGSAATRRRTGSTATRRRTGSTATRRRTGSTATRRRTGSTTTRRRAGSRGYNPEESVLQPGLKEGALVSNVRGGSQSKTTIQTGAQCCGNILHPRRPSLRARTRHRRTPQILGSGEQRLQPWGERGAEATTLRTGSAATRRRTGSTTTRRRTGSRGYNPENGEQRLQP
jgi:hypothetical protein